MRGTFDSVELLVDSDMKTVAESAPADPVRLNRHRGLWSFLTRSFYLGQMIVAQQFIGGTAQASLAEEASAGSQDAADASGTGGGSAAAMLQAAGGADESGGAAPTNTIQANTNAGAAPQGFDAVDVRAGAGTEAGAQSLAGAAGGDAVAQAAGDEVASIGEDGAPGSGLPSEGGPLDPILPGAGNNPIETITEPVLDLVNDLGQTTDQILDVVGETLGDVTDLVEVTVDTVLAAVDETVDTVFQVLHSATGSLPLVGPVLAEVTAKLETIVSPTLDTVASVLTDTVDVVGDTVDTLTGALSSIGLGSDVVPALTTTVSNIPNPDTLFSNGKYTDLNITLQSEVVEPVGSVASTAVSSVTDAVFGAIDDLADGDNGPLASLTSTLTSPLADITKGGLGDLFA